MIRIIEDNNGTYYKFTLQANRKVIRVYKLDPNTNKYLKFKIFKGISNVDVYMFFWLNDIGMINWLRLDYYGNFEIWK